MNKVIIGIVAAGIGIKMGTVIQQFWFSVIVHEARKGNEEHLQVLDRYDAIGAGIEKTFSAKATDE